MKRFTTIVALVLMVAMPMMAERVSPETAQKVATTFLNNNGAKSTQLTDLSKAAGFPNLYIFSTESSFVVMAAEDCVKPILGYSLTGRFVAEGMPENLRGWLLRYSDEIQYAIDNKQTSSEIAQHWKDLVSGTPNAAKATAIVGPLIQTQWDQYSPYNNLCPKKGSTRTVTGCVATAMAQVMKFWNHPTKGTGSHSYSWNSQTLSADFESTTYDWGNMTNDYGSSSTQNQRDAVATLMYHCGVSVNMDYNTAGNGGSSAVTYNVMPALQTYFGYAPCMQYKAKNDYSDEIWITLLKQELLEGRPLQYRGSDAGGQGGHSFVCDGYDSDDNFHFNWGWSGYCDGYYSLDDMEPGVGGIGAGNGVYNVGESAIFGIEPVSSLTAPSLSAIASNDIITLTWTAIEEAVSYNIYRDNLPLASNITETSFTDNTVVSGTYYEYYVRAMSEDTVSNPSNRVTKLSFHRDYTPTDLTATTSGNNATLSWNSPENKSTDLHYSTSYWGRTGLGAGTNTYWAEVFDPSRLTEFAGMYINKVSTYLYLTGNYKLIIYEGDPSLEESHQLLEQSFNNSTEKTWKVIEIDPPVIFDHTKELWVILFVSGSDPNSGKSPATCGSYDEIPLDTLNPECYNPRLIGPNLTDWTYLAGNYSWLIRTYLTDGTYTYNLYDNGASVASSLADTNYTVLNPSSNTVHQYTVTTNYYGGESEASNTASLALGTVSIENLALEDNDQMTVTQNSTLTVTGALSNDNPENLILENGAQLFHSGGDVYATVKKDIVAYTTEKNGWNFIASPISTQLETATIDGLIPENEETTFDLYKYNEPNHKWHNYKPKTDNAEPGFAIEPQIGYLYACSENTTLSFAGKLQSQASITIDNLSYSATELKGFNLVGNPLPFNAYVSKSYYKMNDKRTNIEAVTSNSETVAPCTGIIVEATGENESVIFSQTPMQWSNRGQLQIAVAEDKMDRGGSSTSAMQVDNAIISFNEADPLQKFVFNEDNAKLYIPQGDEDFAIACANNQNEMPLNFKPSQDGTFTLTVQPESVKMGYLFLIDNMTGTHINLLTTPNYTFEAKTDDYESRFKLLFAAANEETETFENESFGFIINGQFQSIIGQGLLQVIDLNGRILKSANEMDCIGLDGLTAGVYVIRFTTANSVRTQKIVVE